MSTKLTLFLGSLFVLSYYDVKHVCAQTPQYTVIDLGTLGRKSYARDINEQGQVVGASQIDSGFYHAFLYSDGVMRDLGTLGNEHSEALGLNDNGEVVGVVWNADFSVFHAFLYSQGSMEDLGTLGGKYSAARGINNVGQVVGWSRIGDSLGSNRAFLYKNGVMRSLGKLTGGSDSEAYAINDIGEVVGESATSGFGRYRAFLYSGGSMRNLGTLQGLASRAFGINSLGEIVGESEVGSFGDTRAFLYANSSMQSLGTLGGSSSSANAINDLGQVVGWSLTVGETHAFLYSDGTMLDLNKLIDPMLGWRLTKASAINNAGQIVGEGRNPSGKERGFLLNPWPSVTPDWQAVIAGTAPPRPTYGEPPKKGLGKDSLIVVTHGWIRREDGKTTPPNPNWVDGMVGAIRRNLESRELSNWQVEGYKWTERAWMSWVDVVFGDLLENADRNGGSLGDALKTNGWRHIHFIGHSAGAAVIQSASLLVKEYNPTTTVHTTFLDAYLGPFRERRGEYGKGADWSDSYFSRDAETGGESYRLTEGPLDYAYNVDVTWLDPMRESITVVYSTPSGDVSQTCNEKVTSHSWPHQFYAETVPPKEMPGSEGFGFPLSKEGGNWNFATNAYKVGRTTLKVLGNGELSCTPNPSTGLISAGPSLDFSGLPSASVFKSSPEQVSIRGVDFTLKTASPAWLAVAIPLTNKANFVSLEARFTSASGSEGLLSVYWGTNVIGSVDERVTLPGAQRHMFPLTETASGSTKMLGFRLDAFSSVQSSVVVANVALGFAGIREPFSLSLAGTSAGGLPVMRLTGPFGFNYRLEFSTNLIHWSTIAVLVNTNGTVRFIDQASTNMATRFYRAVVP